MIFFVEIFSVQHFKSIRTAGNVRKNFFIRQFSKNAY